MIILAMISNICSSVTSIHCSPLALIFVSETVCISIRRGDSAQIVLVRNSGGGCPINSNLRQVLPTPGRPIVIHTMHRIFTQPAFRASSRSCLSVLMTEVMHLTRVVSADNVGSCNTYMDA